MKNTTHTQTNSRNGKNYTKPCAEIIEIEAENGFAKTGELPDVPGEDWD